MNPSNIAKLVLGFVVAAMALTITVATIRTKIPLPAIWPAVQPTTTTVFTSAGFQKFASEEEFKTYLNNARQLSTSSTPFSFGRAIEDVQLRISDQEALPKVAAPPALDGGGGSEPSRISQTNVQVLSIDEPDIVKTDGTNLYISSVYPYVYTKPMPAPRIMPGIDRPYPIQPPKVLTSIIKAFPPKDLSRLSTIDEVGNLLVTNKVLVILTNSAIFGFDISLPQSPRQLWKIDLQSRGSQIVASRLYNGNLYIVTSTDIDQSTPCPMRPLTIEGRDFSIPCVEIYHPVQPIPIDSTYTAMTINPKTGSIGSSISFVGATRSSVVYMSEHGLYVTYSYSGDLLGLLYNFFAENGRDLLPVATLSRLANLRTYDISQNTKMIELQTILTNYQQLLTRDERVRFENELANRLKDYLKKHKREVEKTGIVRISLDKFTIAATGEIPGRPLNQFSLDEYQENLRIATTVSQNWILGTTNESTSDVYVLDNKLRPVGSVTDLGVTETIYSVRFVEDAGYVVTFRQTDPFYVLDLSDPRQPLLAGELKIPGFSSYLHPISRDRILGIGKEGSQVKLSLFDVSTPSKPIEIDKYLLSEYSSEVLQNQHAFLLDKKHQIFFFPADRGGYIFSYTSDKLRLAKVTTAVRAERAVYLDDYLYIVGQDKIVVLDERNWQEVNQLDTPSPFNRD